MRGKAALLRSGSIGAPAFAECAASIAAALAARLAQQRGQTITANLDRPPEYRVRQR